MTKKVGKFKWDAFVPLIFGIAILSSALIALVVWQAARDAVIFIPDTDKEKFASSDDPELSLETMISGLDHIWDIAVAFDGATYFTERGGDISYLDNDNKKVLEHPADVVANGEGGMLGMTLDPEFESNRYLYVCFNTASDVRLVRFKVSESNEGLSDRKDVITGLPVSESGRHSGCRPRFGIDGFLWVGTGDAAKHDTPQSKESLGGKILRVDRDGKAAPDNYGDPYDSRIYSFGHRNTQGLAFFSKPRRGTIGYSIEHGPDKNDEINELRPGNFGWAPGPGYNEAVPMTDKDKFPDALDAVWSSGDTTLAPASGIILRGRDWKGWNNRLAVTFLKGRQVRIFDFDMNGKVTSEKKILTDLGRLRAIALDQSDYLLIGTSNGGGEDKIIRVIPK